jgi:hypothetical protein
MNSARPQRPRVPPLSRDPVTMHARDLLLRRQAEQLQAPESTEGEATEEGSSTSSAPGDTATPAPDRCTVLLETLESIAGIEEVLLEDEHLEEEHLGEESLHEEVHSQGKGGHLSTCTHF